MLYIHIIAGLLSIGAGAIALAATKGSGLHRKSGRVFAVAMLVMTGSAAFIAIFVSPLASNVIAASVTFYFVCTGVLAVRMPVSESRGVLAGLMVFAIATGLFALQQGFDALENPGEVPAGVIFMFASLVLLGAALDARLLWVGHIAGKHRLARHLWRMSYAMWIATTSFFLGQSDEFPEPLRNFWLLSIPVLLVTGMLFYWLARVLIKRERAVSKRQPMVQS